MTDLTSPQRAMTEGRGEHEPTALEFYRAAMNNPARERGIGGLLGMSMTSIEAGVATFELKTAADHSNTRGIVHGGIAATMLDSAMACAIHSTMSTDDELVTVELKVNYIKAAGIAGEVLTARGTIVHVGHYTAVADGQIRNNDGQLIAHGTTTCLIRRSRSST